ncbi:Caffeic acid 3-O-methyltransferase [Gossypium arboreum]|uniref:Caffeic acid 3-O-methyltransferase n=1 Tax=Gossypium arboreum TaxID=29729 RepID=A0A0B0M9T7_GOSAR|nr:Caffeic acid 3-O-methyltransferase [Gossypium arboreum]
MPAYQYKSLNPENAKRHDTAMTNLSKIIMKKILERYNGFQGVTTLVDVGGGYGVTLNIIISRYPSIKGINYELPHVVQEAPSFPGIEHVGGDMFSTVPKADTIMMKEVLHNWDDEHCLKLLKNCYEALEEKG